MTTKKWKIKLRWVEAHAGVRENELARKLAKEATANESIKLSYKRIPKRVIIKQLEDDSVKKWQTDWTNSTKGKITKVFFPDVKERLNMNINFTQDCTTMVTGHGKINLYSHRFKIIKNPICPCGNSDQNIDNLIFECKLLNKERNALKQSELQTNDWPNSKSDLTKKHVKEIMKFTNAIPLDEINAEQNSYKAK
jgi:hypothetical protein